jgi:hypothetical protein
MTPLFMGGTLESVHSSRSRVFYETLLQGCWADEKLHLRQTMSMSPRT